MSEKHESKDGQDNEEIVKKLSEEFSDRYTDNDPEYKDAGGERVPPCVEDWNSRPQFGRGGHPDNRRHDNRGHHGDRSHDYRHHDNRSHHSHGDRRHDDRGRDYRYERR